jgi:hypothetical protein
MPPASRLVRRRNTARQPSIRFSSMTDNLMLHSLNSRSSEIRRRETNLSNECEAIRTLGFYGSRHRKIAWIKFDSVVNFGLSLGKKFLEFKVKIWIQLEKVCSTRPWHKRNQLCLFLAGATSNTETGVLL